jgi:hypothetical protein
MYDYNLLPPFQTIRRIGFSKYITFAMYLDYVYMHSKSNASRIEKPNRLFVICNGGVYLSDVLFYSVATSMLVDLMNSKKWI